MRGSSLVSSCSLYDRLANGCGSLGAGLDTSSSSRLVTSCGAKPYCNRKIVLEAIDL